MYCCDGYHFTSWTQVEAYWQAHYPQTMGSAVLNPRCGHQVISPDGLPCSRETTCPSVKDSQRREAEYQEAKRAGGCCGSA